MRQPPRPAAKPHTRQPAASNRINPLTTQPAFGDYIGPWIKFFALLPHHTLDAGWLWLQPIYCRRVQKHWYLSSGAEFWWHYRKYINLADIQN